MRIPTALRLLGAALLLSTVPSISGTAAHAAPPHASDVQPLERAHAHNDYEHERPLLDALDHGFTSAEADVWVVGGELYIGHDEPDMSRTLTNTYLQPLAERIRDNSGSAYRGWAGSFRLMIDVKNDGPTAWRAIEAKLAEYPWMMTTYKHGRVKAGAVTAVVSGNRDLPAMQAADVRRSFFDGRPGDLTRGLSSDVVAMVSDNWSNQFTWQGVGPMPAAERAKLHRLVESAHAQGFELRFWATPDLPGPNREAIWRELVDAGVDVLNTDHLADLQAFLLAEDPAEQAAA